MGEISVKTGNNARNGGKNSLNRLIRCVCGKKIGPDPRNFNQRVSLGRNDLLIRTFLNGSMPGDKKGRAVIPLTAYNNNTITVNAENLPQSVELTENAINVTPTENAIIYKKVKYRKINTYIVKVISSNGFVIPMGSIAKNEQNQEIGYVNNGGILLMNLEEQDEGIISVGDCKFDSRSLKKNMGKVQEIKCD
ncbi:fimbria/pilus outer membrane usher protein [Citrobacter amalonaticus]